MCGIIGRVSTDKIPIKTLFGLKELEYRGYDSYGILFYNIDTQKSLLDKDKNELTLEKLNKLKEFESNIEIGHTRWATHGIISKENAHPHCDMNCEFFVVMNGIVENYKEIKNKLENENVIFSSQTDSEVIPQLFAKYFDKNNLNINDELLKTIKKVLNELKGEFSFILKYKQYLIIYKNINPIIIGESKNEIFISSDSSLVQNNSNNYKMLEDGEIFFVELNNSKDIIFEHYDKNFNEIERGFNKSLKEEEVITKNTKYFMEKEMLEQKNIKKILTKTNHENLKYLISEIKNNSKYKKIFISAAGTSYHASIYLHYTLLENEIMSNIILASELKNYINIIKDSIIIVFSQSGETADLIFPLKELEENNEIFTITNTKNSTLDRFAKKSIYLNCGKEIGVASTKAFTSQIFISIWINEILNKNNISKINESLKITNFQKYEILFEKILEKNIPIIKKICFENKDSSDFFFLGRDKNFPLALEGALKLKEISYIHAEGFAGGELKHGSLALIEKDVPSIIIGDSDEIISNAIEIKTRGGIIIGISEKNNEVFDYFLEVPNLHKDIFITLMLQYIAFEMTLLKGYNPDKPRNLAKSVTVK